MDDRTKQTLWGLAAAWGVIWALEYYAAKRRAEERPLPFPLN